MQVFLNGSAVFPKMQRAPAIRVIQFLPLINRVAFVVAYVRYKLFPAITFEPRDKANVIANSRKLPLNRFIISPID